MTFALDPMRLPTGALSPALVTSTCARRVGGRYQSTHRSSSTAPSAERLTLPSQTTSTVNDSAPNTAPFCTLDRQPHPPLPG